MFQMNNLSFHYKKLEKRRGKKAQRKQKKRNKREQK